jgi:glc operon protein GlcG
MEEAIELKLALATAGRITNLKGGVPIIVEGQVLGGIGIGSGTGEQDREVALAAIAKVFG